MATRSLTPSRKKTERPFYEAPDVQTSAKIIAEARTSLRALPTERPFTPAGDHRKLFGQSSVQGRPPSAFSTIGAQHFSVSRPPTGHKPHASHRLTPIEAPVKTSPTNILKEPLLQVPPPTLPPSLSSRSQQRLRGSGSGFASSRAQSRNPVPAIPLPDEGGLLALNYSESNLTSFSSSTVSVPDRENHAATETYESGTLASGGQEDASQNSRELVPKKSQHSPVHSKRSLSACVMKKVHSEDLHSDGKIQRVVSAGDTVASRRRKKDSSRQQDSSSGLLPASGEDVKRRKAKKPKESALPPPEPAERKASVSSQLDLPFWENSILPLLRELESTSYKDVECLRSLCESLWVQLETNDLLGRSGGVGGTKRRGKVLRTVFKLLDHQDPIVLLKVARIIIGMQVTGKNLLNVCKLLFALSRVESNDEYFTFVPVTGCLVDALLLLVDLREDQETLVYGLGTLKLLASCPEVREQLTRTTQVMPLLINLLGMCSESGENINILIQLTGALRNLSDLVLVREIFVTTSIISHLAHVLSNHMDSVDIVFNISRLFSKLTLTAGCLTATLQCPSLLPLFLRALTVHKDHTDIVVRLFFILGNVTADNESTRSLLYLENSAPEYITPLLHHFILLEIEMMKSWTGDSNEDSSSPEKHKVNDVLIKLVRLIANLSVSPEVGPAISTDENIVSSLFTILENFSPDAYEELLVNCLGTLNNLTYYSKGSNHIMEKLEEVTSLLVDMMMADSSKLLLEATRVCGNLSRYPVVRTILMENKVDEVAVTLLDSGRREVVYASCGLLVNLLSDTTCQDNVALNGGLRKLVEVLHDLGLGDWQLASLVCKTLWNYSERLSSAADCFGDKETTQLVQILTAFLDEARVFPPRTGSSEDSEVSKQFWKTDFLPVAQPLLERIKTYSSLMPTT